MNRSAARISLLSLLLLGSPAQAHAAPEEAERESEQIPHEVFPEVVEVLAAIYFPSDSARLSAAARTALDELAERWRGRGGHDGVFLEIRGHSDGSGSLPDNLRLARLRAEAVERHLRKRGIPAERLVVLALGPSDPIGDESTAAGRARNRCAEIVAVQTGPER